MPLTARQSVAGVAAGVVTQAYVVVLGLLVPYTDPARDQVDNALVALGSIGLLLVLLVPRSGLVTPSLGLRIALATYALLSLAAVVLADFGDAAHAAWVTKLLAVGLAALAVGRLLRRA